MRKIYLIKKQTPAGELLIAEFEGRICFCDWSYRIDSKNLILKISSKLEAQLVEVKSEKLSINKTLDIFLKEIDLYFQEKLENFSIDKIFNGTEFQIKIWNELLKISYGSTKTYLDIAKAINKPKAVRAVATAIGSNVMSILVPCHRVIGSNGKISGYAGGVEAKIFLLNLEKTKK